MSTPAELTITEAAQRLGVHYMTVYRYVRLGMLPARRDGSGWRIDAADLDRLDTSPTVPARKRSAPWKTRLQTRMLAGDDAGSWGVVEAALASGMEPRDFYCDVLTPVLHSIGSLWESGQIGIEEEHLASNVAAGVIGRLSPRFSSRGRSKGTVVIAMPAGEQHDLGLAMLADILRSDGYRVLNLGANTPTQALLAAIEGIGDLTAIALGIVHRDGLNTTASLIESIRGSIGAVPILVGGAAVTEDEDADRLGADAWSRDAREVGPMIAAMTASSRRRTQR